MGLDMYLTGHKHFFRWGDRVPIRKEDGFEVTSVTVKLGYWRKHPNLHGFIVQRFAEGKDECQNIELDSDDIQAIIHAVRIDALPHTTGFFFGQSTGDEALTDIRIFEDALLWLEGTGPKDPIFGERIPLGEGMVAYELLPPPEGKEISESRSVIYQASW